VDLEISTDYHQLEALREAVEQLERRKVKEATPQASTHVDPGERAADPVAEGLRQAAAELKRRKGKT